MGTITGLYKECLVPVRLVWFRVVEFFWVDSKLES